jgi:hypothetical protein
MLSKTIILAWLVCVPVVLLAQEPPDPKAQKEQAAAEELESVIAEAGKLNDKLSIVHVRSRAAALISFSDPARSDSMFLETWKSVKQETDPNFDKEQAASLILKFLFPRNSKLANRLLREQSVLDESSLQSRATGSDPGLRRLAKLSAELVDRDPATASGLLERSLSGGVTPAGLMSLLRLRERDPLLSNFVVAKTLEGIDRQPTVIALPGLHLLSSYVFPSGDTGRTAGYGDSSLESLQFTYFSTAYSVLRGSLGEADPILIKEKHYTQADLRFRASYQAQMALVLAALAPRFGPALVGELNGLARNLLGQLPPNVRQMAQFTASRLGTDTPHTEDPETAIPLAISNGDYEEAGRLIEGLKTEEMKTIFTQTLFKVQARSLLNGSELVQALTVIRKIDDPSARLVLYLEALKVARKKDDPAFSSLVTNEARTLIPQTERNGLHVRALLSFAAQLTVSTQVDDAWLFLDDAVLAINALPKTSAEPTATTSPQDLAWAALNDPQSLLDSPELERAFSLSGGVDLERALNHARKINTKSVQLAARLAVVGETIKRRSRNRPAKPATKVRP